MRELSRTMVTIILSICQVSVVHNIEAPENQIFGGFILKV
jgi:hypothetical protein